LGETKLKLGLSLLGGAIWSNPNIGLETGLQCMYGNLEELLTFFNLLFNLVPGTAFEERAKMAL
jgi:hypothetical protein